MDRRDFNKYTSSLFGVGLFDFVPQEKEPKINEESFTKIKESIYLQLSKDGHNLNTAKINNDPFVWRTRRAGFFGYCTNNQDVLCNEFSHDILLDELSDFPDEKVTYPKHLLEKMAADIQIYIRQRYTDRLKNLFMSPEALEDIRNWGVKQIDDVCRKAIFAC